MTEHYGSRCHSSESPAVQLYYYFFHVHLEDFNTFFDTLFPGLCSIYVHTLRIFVNTAHGALCCPAVKAQLSYSLAQPMNK